MIDLNNFNLQGFDQAQFQGDNTALPQTAGLAGTTDQNGLFGATTTTNDIFGQTINTEAYGANFYGANQTLPGTTLDNNAVFGDTQAFNGTNIDTNAALGTTATDPNNLFGTTQVLPVTIETNAFFSNPTITQTQFKPTTTTQTKTTTQTTYGMTDTGQVGQTTYGTIPGAVHSEYLATGANQTTFNNYGVPMASVGYGTTAADLKNATQQKTFELTTPQTFTLPTTTQTIQTTQTTYDTAALPQTTQTEYTTTQTPISVPTTTQT